MNVTQGQTFHKSLDTCSGEKKRLGRACGFGFGSEDEHAEQLN